jgi:transposase
MVRHRLTDEQWECIAEVFPTPAKTGRPRADLRDMVDGILWLLKAGSPWRDLPEEFGPWETVYTWFDRWTSNGTLDEILRRLKAAMTETEDFDHELWCIDGTVVRAHRCAAGGGKKGSPRNPKITLSAGRGVVFRQKSTSSAMGKGIRSTPK